MVSGARRWPNSGRIPATTPGVFFLVQYRNEPVLICQCKNPESFRLDVELIKRLRAAGGFEQVVGKLTAVGDRQNYHFENISRMVASVCDGVFISPPDVKYLRRREGGEIVRLLSAAMPPERVLGTSPLSLENFLIEGRRRFSGRILFVIFSHHLEKGLDLARLYAESEPHTSELMTPG